MKSGKITAWLLCAVILVGFAGVWRLQRDIDHMKDSIDVEQDQLAFRSGTWLSS